MHYKPLVDWANKLRVEAKAMKEAGNKHRDRDLTLSAMTLETLADQMISKASDILHGES